MWFSIIRNFKFFNLFFAFGTLTTLLVSIDYRIAILIVVSGILSMILRQAGNKVWYEQKKKLNQQKKS